MSGGQEGTRWPEPPHAAPFTWGSPPGASEDAAPGAPFTWGPSQEKAPPEIRYATWGRRGAGFLIDFLLMATLPIAFFILFGASIPDTSNPNPPIGLVSWVWFWSWLASSTLFVVYPVWFISRRGQTPGMKKMQIRLLHMDVEGRLEAPNQNQAWGRALAAAAGWLLCFLWILDYLWPVGDRRRQCIHDKAARTVAVDLRDGGWSGRTG